MLINVGPKIEVQLRSGEKVYHRRVVDVGLYPPRLNLEWNIGVPNLDVLFNLYGQFLINMRVKSDRVTSLAELMGMETTLKLSSIMKQVGGFLVKSKLSDCTDEETSQMYALMADAIALASRNVELMRILFPEHEF